MPHPLDGARLKVERARKHLDDLSDEMAAYVATNPYEFGVTRKGAVAIVEVRVTNHPASYWSAIVGDCVGNSRAALDYVAWELASRYAGRELIPGKDRVFFPVGSTPQHPGYVRGMKELAEVYRVPRPALDTIESVQSFSAPLRPLEWLSTLVNQDKHRTLILTLATVFGDEMTVDVNGGTALTTTGAHVVTVPLYGYATGDTGGPSIEVGGGVAVNLVFGNVHLSPSGPVDWTLGRIIETTADAISRFEPFFQ